MSNFSNLFQTYNSETEYQVARAAIIEKDEAYQSTYATYTIGYGFDIRAFTGVQISTYFLNVGIFTTANTTGSGQYAALYAALQNYGTGGTANSGFAAVNTDFASAFGTSGITQERAIALIDQIAPTYESYVSGTAATYDVGAFATGNDSLHALLFSEDYNNPTIFGTNQAEAIAADNVPAFIENELFFNSTEGGSYNQGLENRRINDLAATIGLPAPPVSTASGSTVDTQLNFGTDVVAAVQVYEALTQYSPEIGTEIESLDDDDAAANLNNFISNTITNARNTVNVAGTGYYLISTGAPDLDANSLASAISSLTGVSVSGDALTKINSVFDNGISFTGSNFTDGSGFIAGGFLHVPSESVSAGTAADPTQTYVMVDGSAYAVGPSLNGSTNGTLFMFLAGGQTIAASVGTWQSIPSSTTVALPLGDGVTATFNLDPSITLPDGTVINLTSIPSTVTLTTPPTTDTPEQALLSYLSQLGDTTTASALDTDNYDYLNPTGTAYTVTGTVSGSTDTFTDNGGVPGAVVTGLSGKTNILDAYGDLTQDTISDIQTLDIGGATVLTAAEFAGSTIEGDGALTFASAGTYSVAGLSGIFSSLTAEDWGGTTITGNNTNGQTLTASTFGNDTLTAGNGTGDTLFAGGGVDTITGGTGGDTFYTSGLASGSSITGEGTGNVLRANGDISGATISDIQTLVTGGVTLTAAQLSGFSAITAQSEDIDITAHGAGTYTLPGTITLGSEGSLTVNTDATASTTLEGGSLSYITFSADGSSGNNTLTTGAGSYNNLFADNSDGNNTLSAGNGSEDTLTAEDSFGNNNLTVTDTSGSNNDLIVQGSSGTNTLTAGNGSEDVLNANDSSGNNSLTAGNGSSDDLYAEDSDGANTLVAGSGANDYLSAAGSFGDNTLTAGSGNDVYLDIDSSSGNNIVTAGGNDQTIDADDSSGSNTLNAESYGSISITANGSIGDNTLEAGNGADISLSAQNSSGNNALTVGNGNDDDLDVTGSSGNNMLTAGSGSYDTLVATGSTGRDILNAGSGSGDTLYAGMGDDELNGGTGTDSFTFENNAGAGTTVTGVSGGSDALYAFAADISAASVSYVPVLQDYVASLTLSGATFNQFTSLVNDTGSTATLVIVGSGTYSLSGKTVSGSFNLITDSGATITGNNTAGQVLYANSTGTSTVNAGTGAGDVLYAGAGTDTLNAGSGGDTLYDGTGTDTLNGSTGNDTFNISHATSGTTVTGGGGSDTLVATAASLTGISVSGVTTLDDDNASLGLTSSQFGAFTTIDNELGASGVLDITNASGSYSFSGKTLSGSVLGLSAAGSTGTVTLTGNSTAGETLIAGSGTDTLDAGSGTGDVLYAGSGTDTLNAGSGGDTLYDGTGTATLNGGAGADTFYVTNPLGGTTVNAGSGDTVYASGNDETGAVTDTINISSGTVYVGAYADADIYGSDNTIVTANNSAVGAHNGSGNTVDEGGSSGVWLTDNGGSTVDAGAGDYVFVSGNGTSGDDNIVNISSGSVDIETDTQTDVFGSDDTVTTGANSTAGIHYGNDNTVTEGNSSGFWLTNDGGSTVNAGTDDYIFVSGNGTSDTDNYLNISGGSVDIDVDTEADISGASNTITIGDGGVAGVNGNSNTISLGSGAYFWVNGGTGNSVAAGSWSTVTLGGGVGATINGGGNDAYEFGSTFAASTIDNNESGGLTAANGVIGFGSGISDENLWFKQSGNNLLIDLLDTTDQITVDNWFGSNAGAQLSEIDADGLKLTTQVASLVSAMATYQSAHTGFNPQTATSMPTDTTLQNAIAASWHS